MGQWSLSKSGRLRLCAHPIGDAFALLTLVPPSEQVQEKVCSFCNVGVDVCSHRSFSEDGQRGSSAEKSCSCRRVAVVQAVAARALLAVQRKAAIGAIIVRIRNKLRKDQQRQQQQSQTRWHDGALFGSSRREEKD